MSKLITMRPHPATKGTLAFAVVASQFNDRFVTPLVENATRELEALEPGAPVTLIRVPGSFEIPLLVQTAAESEKFHAILALGVIFDGETAHADLIARSVTQSLLDISLKHKIPVINEILQLKNEEQAEIRCLGQELNRGIEAARAAVATARTLHNYK